FAAPLIVWLLATRRYKAALLTVVVAATAVLSAWAVIGFSAIERYPSILNANSDVFSSSGPFLQGLLLQLHYSRAAAAVVGLGVGAGLLAATFAVRDIEGFTLAICATVIAAPVAWIGYGGLLVVPLAVI